MNKAKLTSGDVKKSLVRLTFPMMLGMAGMVVFNIADTFFVSQLGTDELAAISYTFPVIMVVASLALGLGVGVMAVVSRAIGEGNQHKVQRLTTDSLILSIILVGGLVIVGLFTINPLFQFLGAPEKLLPLIKQFMTIWYAGIITVVIPMVGNSAIRATGDMKTPTMVMLVAVTVNLILDPVLIFGWGPFPRMELAGAALATVISRSITLVVALYVLYKREKLITFNIPSFKEIWTSWKEVMYIGLPSTATSMIGPISIGLITKLIATFGTTAVAAFGIATRIESFALLAVMALSSVLSPFIGQNWGAKKYDRAKLAVKYSNYFALIWGGVMALFLAFFGGAIGALFDDNPSVNSVVVAYFLIIPINYGLQGIFRQANTVFSVLKKPLVASLLALIQSFVLYIPLAYIGAEWYGIHGIFGAASISFIVTGVISFFWLKASMLKSMEYDYTERIVKAAETGEEPQSIGFWVAKLNRITTKRVQKEFQKYELENSSYAYLLILRKHGSLSSVELEEKLDVSSMACKQAIHYLLSKEYTIEQISSSKTINYTLSERANKITEGIIQTLGTWNNSLVKDFSDLEKQTTLKLLKRMSENASKHQNT